MNCRYLAFPPPSCMTVLRSTVSVRCITCQCAALWGPFCANISRRGPFCSPWARGTCGKWDRNFCREMWCDANTATALGPPDLVAPYPGAQALSVSTSEVYLVSHWGAGRCVTACGGRTGSQAGVRPGPGARDSLFHSWGGLESPDS